MRLVNRVLKIKFCRKRIRDLPRRKLDYNRDVRTDKVFVCRERVRAFGEKNIM